MKLEELITEFAAAVDAPANLVSKSSGVADDEAMAIFPGMLRV